MSPYKDKDLEVRYRLITFPALHCTKSHWFVTQHHCTTQHDVGRTQKIKLKINNTLSVPIIHSGYVTANSMLMFVACHNIIKKKMVQANQR